MQSKCSGCIRKYHLGKNVYKTGKRLLEHDLGEGAKYTKKRLPVSMVYFEEYSRIDAAFEREKQIQRWSRKKKEALISGDIESLKRASRSRNKSNQSKK
jgi:putative endonuclease